MLKTIFFFKFIHSIKIVYYGTNDYIQHTNYKPSVVLKYLHITIYFGAKTSKILIYFI